MAAVMNALESVRMPTHTGENGHAEFAWQSSSLTITHFKETFVQLFFQLVRVHYKAETRMAKLKELGGIYADIYRKIRGATDFDDLTEEYDRLVIMLRSLPNQTRDCVKGKGERDLAYTLVMSDYERMAETDETVARRLLIERILFWARGNPRDTSPPPGSWKDLIAFSNFMKEWTADTGMTPSHYAIVRDLMKAMADQVYKDTTSESPSLASKWAPRESSKKQRWLFYRFVRAFTPAVASVKDFPPQSPPFKSACKTVRRTLSSINEKIATIEVKQCDGRWSEISPKTVPSVALQKQKVALLNKPRRGKKGAREGEDRHRSDDPDRVTCAENFREFIAKAVKKDNGVVVKAERVSLYDLVRDALGYGDKLRRRAASAFPSAPAPDMPSMDEMLLLEEQWKSNGKQIKAKLPPMIPMIDVSGSMTCDNCTPMYYAIGLGLRASEKTHPVFRHSVLTFSHEPAFIRLPEPPETSNPEHEGSFIKRALTVHTAPWGMNTDFYKALQLVLNTLVEHKVPAEEAKGLVLAVFSDMQIDEASSGTNTPMGMHSEIKNLYALNGYEPPHILYWNLRTSNGFPTVTTEKNVTMLSGFSPVLLSLLEEKGIDALSEFTPYDMVWELLNTPRFNPHYDD